MEATEEDSSDIYEGAFFLPRPLVRSMASPRNPKILFICTMLSASSFLCISAHRCIPSISLLLAALLHLSVQYNLLIRRIFPIYHSINPQLLFLCIFYSMPSSVAL